jgi:autotransporter adhesin
MNNTYRCVWSETDQTWVAAPETATAGRKASRRVAVIATSALGIAVALSSQAVDAATVGTVGQGGLELCTGASGYAWGSSGGSEALDCSTDGKGTTDGLAFSLNNAADTKGGYGMNASTAQVAGYKNGTLNIKGASVMVYGPTTFDSVVTMSNQKIVQLALGKVSSDSTEAVNGSQLYAVSSSVANAVQYDSSAHNSVTLGGSGHAPVALTNVANGALNANSTDAVNGSQLNATNANVTSVTNTVNNITNGGGIKYFHTNSTAGDSSAAGANSTAIGPVASAAGTAAIALGANTQATGDYSEAIGNSAVASNLGDIALGASATATGGGSYYATAIGTNSSATAYATTALGAGAKATQGSGTALGYQANAAGLNSTSIGTNSAATQTGSMAIGQAANASVANSVALGTGSVANTAAVGTASGTIGGTTYTYAGKSPTGTVSVGAAGAERTITNVAAGRLDADSTDAINGSQLYASDLAMQNLITDGNFVAYDDSTRSHVTFGVAGSQTTLSNVAAGTQPTDAVNVAQMKQAVITGNPYISGFGSGEPAQSTSIGAVALGLGSKTTVPYSISVGDASSGLLRRIVNVAPGVEMTDAATVSQLGSSETNMLSAVNNLKSSTQTALQSLDARVGALSEASSGTGEVSASTNAQSSGNASSALATGNGSVALGSGSVANEDNTVSVGSDGTTRRTLTDADGNTTTVQSQINTRRIVNLAAGQDDTDAVNVSQLKSVASALGGGAGINAAGGFIAPSYSVGGTTVNNVGDAIANLDNRVLKNTADIASINTALDSVASSGAAASSSSTPHLVTATRTLLGASPVGAASAVGDTASGSVSATDTASTTDVDAVHYDTADHSNITLSSTSGANVGLSGLQNGTLSANSTDAVSGQQLYATNQQVASISQAVQNISTTGSTAVSVNSTSGVAAASGAQSVAVGGGAVATGANSSAIGDKANASANNAVAIGANSIANRDNAVSVGQEGAERQIVNVAAGTSGTDAVNLNQLNSAIAQQSNAIGQQISNLQGSINTVSKNAYAGVAAAMAMPNLTPSGPGRTVVAAGGGYYMGGSAAAVGVTYRSANMHWLMNGAVSVTSTGNPGVRAQVGYEF